MLHFTDEFLCLTTSYGKIQNTKFALQNGNIMRFNLNIPGQKYNYDAAACSVPCA